MWYKSQSNTMPSVVDMTSSKVYVYIRKNITQITVDGLAVYEYDEIKIPKEVYSIFRAQEMSDERLSEIEDVIAEIIGGELV